MEENKLAIPTLEEIIASESALNPAQFNILYSKTPSVYIKKRPAKGGGTWEYVTGGYVKKQLNRLFGFNWDFEIIEDKVMIEFKQVVVKGRLTCRVNDHTIVKMQYGRKDIAFKKNTETPLDLGNDLKAAATDCLKKCASEIGVAADIYNAEEFKEAKVKDVKVYDNPIENNKITVE